MSVSVGVLTCSMHIRDPNQLMLTDLSVSVSMNAQPKVLFGLSSVLNECV